MSTDSIRTLFHPFERDLLAAPAPGTRTLFLGAQPGFLLPEGWSGDLVCVQPLKPLVTVLERERRTVSPTLPFEDFDGALILLDRHRGQGERRMVDALRRVKPGGGIVVGGSNSEGAASFARRAATLLPVEQRLSKHHGTVFWLRRPDDPSAAIAAYESASATETVDGRFETAPGMFSHGRIDAGSMLLAGSLPDDLSGSVADFGAGWGYLAVTVLERCPSVADVALYEAHWNALEAARRNVTPVAGDRRLSFHWTDLASGPPATTYDAIVMNPPFHTGGAATPALGETFIKVAAKALKARGRLWVVANTGLPYEKVLGAVLPSWKEVARADGFKVLEARR